MFKIISSIFLLFLLKFGPLNAKKYKYHINGTLLCNDILTNTFEPKNGRSVELYDRNSFLKKDNAITETKTDGQGKFDLEGFYEEDGTAEPYLYVNCGAFGNYCICLYTDREEQSLEMRLGSPNVVDLHSGQAKINGEDKNVMIPCGTSFNWCHDNGIWPDTDGFAITRCT